MKNFHIILAFLALTLTTMLLGTAGASTTTIAWGPGNVHFEVYRGTSYAYVGTPYVAYGHGYYYFPHQTRYYYQTTWHYLNPGWYYWNGTIGGTWYYDGAWVSHPGYWYQPTHNYYYYTSALPNHLSFTDPARITFVEEMGTARCNDIDIATQNVTLRAGRTQDVTFRIDSTAEDTYEIGEIEIVENDGRIDVRAVRKDAFVPPNGSAQFTLRVSAAKDADAGTATAYVKAKGRFADGPSCYADAVREAFNVNIMWNDTSPARMEEDTYPVQVEKANADPTYTSNSYYNLENQAPEVQEPVAQLAEVTGARCSDIDVATRDFTLGELDTDTQTFTLYNRAQSDFYISYLQVSEDSSFANATIRTRPNNVIYAGDSDTFTVRAETFGHAAEAEGHVSVSGTFANGTECGITQIGRAYFDIRTQATQTAFDDGTPRADNVIPRFPDRVEVDNVAAFEVEIVNASDYAGYVELHSDDAQVRPARIDVPPQGSARTTVTVWDLQKDKAWLFYEMRFPGAKIAPRVTTLVKNERAEDPVVVPAATDSLEGATVLDPTVSKNADGTYTVEVTIENTADYPVQGQIEITVPDEWKVTGDQNALVAAGETQKRTLRVTPGGLNEHDRDARVRFLRSDGTVFSKPVAFERHTPATAVALAGLGTNAGLGFGAVLIIAVLVAFAYAKKIGPWKTQGPAEAKLPATAAERARARTEGEIAGEIEPVQKGAGHENVPKTPKAAAALGKEPKTAANEAAKAPKKAKAKPRARTAKAKGARKGKKRR